MQSGGDEMTKEDFLYLWARAAKVRDELVRRGKKSAKWVSPWSVARRLERSVMEDERLHTLAKEEAEKWKEWRQKILLKRRDCERVLRVGEAELANALDAAGQVYTLGTGAQNCMLGRPVPTKCVNCVCVCVCVWRAHQSRLSALHRKRFSSELTCGALTWKGQTCKGRTWKAPDCKE